MKLVLAALFCSPAAIGAISCGNKFTEECIGVTDKRYDPKSSNSLADQAEIWGRLAGYYTYEQYSYGADNLPQVSARFGPFR
jgi:hypothetical protein